MVNPGDSIPTVELEEGGPGNKVNLATEFGDGNGLIIGVPAAFSKSLSASPPPQIPNASRPGAIAS
jgi:2-Cys peroxiredoxin 5